MPEDAVQTNTFSSDDSAETLIEIDGVGKTFTGQDGEQIVALEGTDLQIRRGFGGQQNTGFVFEVSHRNSSRQISIGTPRRGRRIGRPRAEYNFDLF